MTLHTYLTHTHPYQMIIIKDRNKKYYEGNAGLCGKKELWDREILHIKQTKTRQIVTLRIRKSRYIYE